MPSVHDSEQVPLPWPPSTAVQLSVLKHSCFADASCVLELDCYILMFLQNSNLYMDGVEVIKGDVYQYASLPTAMQKWWGVL